MNYYNNGAHKAAAELILNRKTVRFDTALTLTFKYRTSEITRKKILKTYLDVINKKSFGSACWKDVFGYDLRKGIKMATVMEGRFGKEPHFHLAMKTPITKTRTEFHKLLVDCWVKLDKKWPMNITSDKFNDVNPIYYEPRWIRYITKEIDPQHTDSLLIEYCNF